MIAVDSEIRNLIPDDLIREAARRGIERISIGQWYDPFLNIFGVCRPASKEIFLDIGREESLLALYRGRHPELNILPEETFEILFLHELLHFGGLRDEGEVDRLAIQRFRERRDATKKKIIEAVKAGVREGFRARGLL